jgi:hypothetical protein
MPELYGREYTRGELQRMTGTLRQVAGVRLLERADGKARGMRVADVYSGSGFRFEVLLDRALDIGAAESAGRPLAWLFPALGTAAQHEPQGLGWLRTFGGGLMTTGGLTHIGHPDEDAGEALGLHGRVSHIPAENVHVIEEWQGDTYVVGVAGSVRQAALFGENLLLTRRITTHMGANHLLIEDRVRNEAFRPTPHMMLYHCNFGFPVVSPDSAVVIRDDSVNPRDETASKGFEVHMRLDPPQADYAEQVFFHRPHADANGMAQGAIVNRALNFGAYVRYRIAELPHLWQWKMMGAGEYVCALEPANHIGRKRSLLRAEGQLKILAPGEEVSYHVEIGALEDGAAIRRFEG